MPKKREGAEIAKRCKKIALIGIGKKYKKVQKMLLMVKFAVEMEAFYESMVGVGLALRLKS